MKDSLLNKDSKKATIRQQTKYEFEKVIANKAARGFAAQVRAGKIDLGKLPAHRLRWWQELLIEGGGAIPVSVGVGYVFKTVQERKAAEQKVSLLSGELESKENTDALDKLTADAQRKKSEQQKQTPVTVPNKPAIDTQIKKTTIKTPETPVNKEEPVKKTIGLFGPTAPVSANDSTAIK